MKTNNNPNIRTNTANHRSYFDWGGNMQVVFKGNGEIAMMESELVRFFGVTWRKLNHRLQTIVKSSNLHPDERVAGEEPIFISGQLKGCAPLLSASSHHRPVLSVGQYRSPPVQTVCLPQIAKANSNHYAYIPVW